MSLEPRARALASWIRRGCPAGDVERLWAELCAEGLAPVVCRELSRTGGLAGLAPHLVAELRASARATVARNLLAVDELCAILRACAAEGVEVIPLRGPALAEHLWGDPTVRPSGDLDLLVRVGDLPRVAGLLQARGYREVTHRPGFAQRFSYTLTLVREHHGWLVVEPHWTLTYPPFADRLDMEAVWARTVPARWFGLPGRALAPEDLVLHLSLHVLHPDGGAPLLWWWELDRAFRREGERLDWSRLWTTALAAGVAAHIAAVLARVHELFGTPVPVVPETGRLVPRITNSQAFHGREEVLTLLALPGLRARLDYALGLLVPSAEYMRLTGGFRHRRELPLAYLRRWGRLTWRGVRTALGALA